MIRHNMPYIDAKDKKAVMKVLDSNYIAQGDKVKEFEKAIITYLGDNKNEGYACAVSSGTSALFLALYALGVRANDEVILPTYVCSAVLNAIYLQGATPVLVDVNPEDFNISFEETKKAISAKTEAIILPHIYGVPADIDKFKALRIPIIEDCAQAIGAEYKGKKVGTIGDISIFSFYATKLLTTGHGGMVYSNNKRYIERVKDYINFDYRKNYYPRFNFQMTDLQAVLGLSQLSKLDSFIKFRKKRALKYLSLLCNKKIGLQNICVEGERIYYRFVIRIKNVKKIKNILNKRGIEAIIPIKDWELLHNYLKLNKKNFSIAEKIAHSTLSIPIYPALKKAEIEYIIKTLKASLTYEDKS